MPRRPRIKFAGMPQHIVQRGINREPCFFSDEVYFSYCSGQVITDTSIGCFAANYISQTIGAKFPKAACRRLQL